LTGASAGLVYLARGLRLWLPPAVSRLAIAVPLVIALASSAQAIQTQSIVLGDDLQRALGAEESAQWLHAHLADGEVAYCAGHCSESVTYGLIYDVSFISIESKPDRVGQPFYLLSIQAKQSSDVASILDYVHDSSSNYASITRIFEEQDAQIYYLVPKA
jgi:hypothetical protein